MPSNMTQPIAIAKILALENWYIAFLALNGCILVLLIVGDLLKAAFGPSPTKKDNATKEQI